MYFVCVNKPTFFVSISHFNPTAEFITAITSAVVHHLPQVKSSQQNYLMHPIQIVVVVEFQLSDLSPLVLCAVPAIKLE
jgi:hypothetical protein